MTRELIYYPGHLTANPWTRLGSDKMLRVSWTPGLVRALPPKDAISLIQEGFLRALTVPATAARVELPVKELEALIENGDIDSSTYTHGGGDEKVTERVVVLSRKTLEHFRPAPEPTLEELDYNALRAKAKSLGLSAQGPGDEVRKRIEDHLGGDQ